jgi:di- and tripeptidase
LYAIDPYLETGAGDLFSLAWSPTIQTLFVGCQNTSLQWLNLAAPGNGSPSIASTDSAPPSTSVTAVDLQVFASGSVSGTSTPTGGASRKVHKFFDSYPQHERKPADLSAKNNAPRPPSADFDSNTQPQQGFLCIPSGNVIDSAHYGYVYCMAILDQGPNSTVHLATGSGDETVKVNQNTRCFWSHHQRLILSCGIAQRQSQR